MSWASRRGLYALGCGSFGLAVVVLRFLLPTYDRYDWPVQLVSAARVIKELPYVEVHVLYGPLGHNLLGWFQRLSGADLATAGRLFFGLNAILGLVLVALLALAWSPGRDWRAPAVSVLVLAGPLAGVASYSGVAMNLVLLGTLLAWRTFRAPPERQAALAAGCGALVVVLALIRVNFGVYLGAALAAAYAWLAVGHRTLRSAAMFAGGALGAGAIAAAAMWKWGMLAEYVRATLTYIQRFGTRTLPVRAALDQPVYLVAFCGLAASAFFLNARRWVGVERSFMVVLTLSLGSYALLRFDLVHLYPLVLLLGPLVIASASSSATQTGARYLGIGCAVVLASGPLRPIAGGLYRLARPDPQRVLEAGFALDAGAAGVVAELRARNAHDRDVLVASWPGSCECVSHWCANQAVYLAGGWVPPTRIWIPDTAITSWGDAQKQMVEDLERTEARFVAFEAMRSTDCTDRRVVDPGLLSAWVEGRYRRVATIDQPGALSLWYLYERSR